jgi:hypothetical protein
VGDAEKGSEVSTNPKKRLIEARLWGLWDDATMTEHEQKITAAIVSLGTGAFRVLVDLSELPPQLPGINTRTEKLMRSVSAAGAERTAMVAETGSLTHLQAKRLASDAEVPKLRFFRKREAALTWVTR